MVKAEAAAQVVSLPAVEAKAAARLAGLQAAVEANPPEAAAALGSPSRVPFQALLVASLQPPTAPAVGSQ